MVEQRLDVPLGAGRRIGELIRLDTCNDLLRIRDHAANEFDFAHTGSLVPANRTGARSLDPLCHVERPAAPGRTHAAVRPPVDTAAPCANVEIRADPPGSRNASLGTSPDSNRACDRRIVQGRTRPRKGRRHEQHPHSSSMAGSGLCRPRSQLRSPAWRRPEETRQLKAERPSHGPRPTVVLVHGAWADASSWSQVSDRLARAGYDVRVPPNNLRGVGNDAADLASYLSTISGPIVLVGHSYGGMVITNAATGNSQVRALVFVDAYIPAEGDTLLGLTHPPSVFAADPATVFDFVPYSGAPAGAVDLYVKTSVYGDALANEGFSHREIRVMAAAQRPLSTQALTEAVRAAGVGDHPLLGGCRRGRSRHPGFRPDRDGQGSRSTDRRGRRSSPLDADERSHRRRRDHPSSQRR